MTFNREAKRREEVSKPKDIVKRLRFTDCKVRNDAALEIERLRDILLQHDIVVDGIIK